MRRVTALTYVLPAMNKLSMADKRISCNFFRFFVKNHKNLQVHPLVYHLPSKCILTENIGFKNVEISTFIFLERSEDANGNL